MFPETGGRVGTYFYILPTYNQGRKIIWDGMDINGVRFLEAFPRQLVMATNESEMQITMINGSVFQVIGSDKIDSIVGTNPVGCVFSEYALQNPRAWDLIRPILAENDGWAVFITTPRGHNHAKRMYDAAVDDPAWYSSLLTVNDTTKADGMPVITQAAIEAECRGPQPMSEELIQQEYYCSFEGYQQGSYYVRQLRQAQLDKRITMLPFRSNFPVYTFWDIGIGDATAIWFAQFDGHYIDFIDYYEQNGEGVAHYANVLKSKQYTYQRHYWPHDGGNRDFSNGQVRRDTAEQLGIRPVDVVPRGEIDDGIEAVRSVFSVCRFDQVRCARGIDCLTEYRKERDEINQAFKNKPLHNWASNGADAFRTMAKSGFRDFAMSRGVKIDTQFSPYEIKNYDIVDVKVDADFEA